MKSYKIYSKTTLIGIIVISILISIIATIYPIKMAFDKDILNKYIKGNIDKVKITRMTNYMSQTINNKDDIAKIIQDLSKIKMTKYKKNMPTNIKHTYDIAIYVEGNLSIGMSIYDSDYIRLFIDLGNYSKQGTYKILKNSFSIKFIESLF